MAHSNYCLGLIPARWGSSRFEGKPLYRLAKKPLVEWVWRRAMACYALNEVAIATDDCRIQEACEGFGARVIMTSSEHLTGTDRLAEAVGAFPQATHIVNIQGDEPLIEPSTIAALVKGLYAHDKVDMVTAVTPLREEDRENPHVVKCVMSASQRALYFSRSAIPFLRNGHPSAQLWAHKGIYGYRRDFLEKFVQWEPTPLERAESLEQLRALEHDAWIGVICTNDSSSGVDTLEQAQAMESLLA